MKKDTVLFINDKACYNKRYRGDLINHLIRYGYQVKSVGLFDGLSSIMNVLYVIRKSKYVICSNLKSNIIYMLLSPASCGVIIINGFGRYRRSRAFRSLLYLLIKINKNKKYILQNYADYRYFKKNYKKIIIKWIPGSGGKKRKHGKEKGYFVVQRKDKLGCIKKSLIEFCLSNKISRLSVVGCNQSDIMKYSLEKYSIYGVGYKNQEDIFMFGDVFLQPSGYGEGFPHTMADAIMSNVDIVISKEMYVQLGLYKFDNYAKTISDGWLKIVFNEKEKTMFAADVVNEEYYSVMVSEY